jgi:hypothetical protein
MPTSADRGMSRSQRNWSPRPKFGSDGNWNQYLLICSKEPWPLDHRGGNKCSALIYNNGVVR